MMLDSIYVLLWLFCIVYHCKLVMHELLEVCFSTNILFSPIYNQPQPEFVHKWFLLCEQTSFTDESPQTGACLPHLRGGCKDGLQKVRVLERCFKASPRLLLFSQDSASENTKQMTERKRGGLKGQLVFLLFFVCVCPRGVSKGYVYHIVHDI